MHTHENLVVDGGVGFFALRAWILRCFAKELEAYSSLNMASQVLNVSAPEELEARGQDPRGTGDHERERGMLGAGGKSGSVLMGGPDESGGGGIGY